MKLLNHTDPTIKYVAGGLLLILCCFSKAQAQKTKGPLQLADEYFAAGEYYTAANLYEQYLHPPKTSRQVSEFPLNVKRNTYQVSKNKITDKEILFRQAESYRLAHYWDKAATIYQQLSEQYPDPNGEGAQYWLAVCQRNLGDIAQARQSLNTFLTSNNNPSSLKTAAEKELRTINFIQQQQQRADSILFTVGKIDAVNSSVSGLFGVAATGNNQYLVSSTRTDSIQTAGINPYRSNLFLATLSDNKFDHLTPLDLSMADPANNLGAGTLSHDGRYLYFTAWKKENGKNISSIYYTERTDSGWRTPRKLMMVDQAGYNSKQPYCTTDGKYLFFSSDRPGGAGKFDIWYAPLNNDGTTGNPVNAGTGINTPEDEVAPFYHVHTGTLVFSSLGYDGMGGFDLFAAKGDMNHWEQPMNLGFPVNSPRDDIYFYADENKDLLGHVLLSSDRGSGCCLETYALTRQPKDKIVNGLVRDCADNMAIEGARVVMQDNNGKTWETTTNKDGRYSFALQKEPFSTLRLSVTKDDYRDTFSLFTQERIDESDLLTDHLYNTAICIQQIPPPEPEPVLVIKAENVVTVYFDFDRSRLKPTAIAKLDSIYQVLVDNPTATLQISGYTDGLGSDAYNKILSDKRARACAEYLIRKGTEAVRISFVSFGACCPVEMEIINGRDNPDGRSMNRRALINIKKD
ncbi:MAG: OmpA family protein [Terrimonas sp.]|nr:OmpA family protein [Terrimonas sp.]